MVVVARDRVIGWALALVPPVVVMAGALATDPRWRLQLFEDDASYYLGVARHVAAGEGSTFAGLVETNGYHPLWMLLLVPVARLVEDPATLVLAVVALHGALWAWSVREALALGRAIGCSVAVTGAALSAYAVLALLTGRLAFNGMESTLLLPLLLLAVHLVVTAGPGTADDRRLGVVLAVVCLTRLDAVVAVGPLALVAATRDSPSRSSPPARSLVVARMAHLLGPAAGALAAYAGLNLVLFGTALPVSGSAKAAGAPFVNTEPLVQFLQAGDVVGRPLWFGVVGLVLVAAAVAVTRTRAAGPGVDPAPRRLLAAVLALVVGQALLLVYLVVGTSFRVWPWYHYQLVVFAFGAALLVLRAAADRWEPPVGRLAPVAVAGLLLVVAAVGLRSEDPAYAAAPPAAAWVREHLPADAVLAMGDRAGIFGLLADRPLLHLEGLVADVDTLHAVADGRLTTAMREAGVDYYVRYGPPGAGEGAEAVGDCWRFDEPFQGDGPTSTVTVCDADLVLRRDAPDGQLSIWRYNPEIAWRPAY